MHLSLPGKKVQALIIVIVGIFIAYFISTSSISTWFHSTFLEKTEAPLASSLENTTISNIESDLDTDGDGLKDWQELLWGSDKNNKDTDKDGVNDSKEIEDGRDPAIAGPDDSLEKTRGISASSVTAFSKSVTSDPDNISQTVSKDLFAKFMSLQMSDNLNSETQEKVVADVIANIDPGSIPPRYSLTDIKVVSQNEVTLRTYGNQVAEALFDLQKSITPQSTNKQGLASYSATIEGLKNLSVPNSLGLSHLQLLNNFNASYQMLILLAEYEKDPVKGLIALKSLQTNNENALELFKTIALEFKNNDIIFDKSEAGYLWSNY